VGLQAISTIEECQSAAEQVGITITEMVGPGSWAHVPCGCTVLQGSATPESGAVGTSGRVHFSTTSGDNNGGSGGYVLICKQAPTPAPTLAHEVANSDTHNIASDLPRIVVMISGITLDHNMRLRGGNIVDHMTGTEDHREERVISRPGPRPWDTFKKHVVGPLKRDFHERVDIFVCTNELSGAVPEEVTAAFTINVGGHTSSLSLSQEQFDRSKACFSQVLGFGRNYTYFIKVRPDFVFLTDIEDYSGLRRDCMHTRFQHVWNIAGLRRCHSQLIFDRCHGCNGRWKRSVVDASVPRFGWIVDDMVFVAPFELAASVFISSEEIRHWSGYEMPNRHRWIDHHGLKYSTEGQYTKALVMNKVPVCPLCINGWPKSSNRDWHEHEHECENANSTYACGRQSASVDEWIEYIKTGRLPGSIQHNI
jgi:hypothetical protein